MKKVDKSETATLSQRTGDLIIAKKELAYQTKDELIKELQKLKQECDLLKSSYSKDISEFKQAEEALSRQKDALLNPCYNKKFLSMKIVIADDSSQIRERIKDLLNDLNNVEIVGEAVDGLELIQLIQDKKPDFVILDIRMPEMNGIEVLRKIREMGIKVKICMLTSYSYEQYKERCFAEGADYFFDKNLDIKQITDLISTLANNHKGV